MKTNGAGTYERRGRQWFHNGLALAEPAQIKTRNGVWLVRIDGNSPGNYFVDGFISNKDIIERGMNEGTSNFPAGITEFFQGTFLLPPGAHTIEVMYLALRERGISYSTGSMLWEQRYLFEGYVYNVTAEAIGGRILYGINRE